MEKQVYLGDGLYASLTGGMVRLHTIRSSEEGLPELHEIYLESAVFDRLVEFVKPLVEAGEF